MFASTLARSFRPVLQRAAVPARAFSVSAARSAGAGPPQLLGEGGKTGEIPTE